VRFALGTVEYRVKAFIFDKDGTLLSLHHWTAIMLARRNALVRSFALPTHVQEKVLIAMGVDPELEQPHPNGAIHRPRQETEEKVAAILSETLCSSFPVVLAAVKRIFAAVDRGFPWHRYLRPTPGAVDLLKDIKRAGGKVGVLTHDSTAPTRLHLQHAGFDRLVDAVIGLDIAPAPKPDPRGVFLACKFLGVEPHETVIVGDGPEDIRAGKAAGCLLTIGVLTGKGSSYELSEADHLLRTLKEIRISA